SIGSRAKEMSPRNTTAAKTMDTATGRWIECRGIDIACRSCRCRTLESGRSGSHAAPDAEFQIDERADEREATLHRLALRARRLVRHGLDFREVPCAGPVLLPSHLEPRRAQLRGTVRELDGTVRVLEIDQRTTDLPLDRDPLGAESLFCIRPRHVRLHDRRRGLEPGEERDLRVERKPQATEIGRAHA